MSTHIETQSITTLIHAFAEALNSANVKSIASHYTTDGVFFPDKYPSITSHQIDSLSGSFFKNKTFSIQFHIKDITVHDDFAFIESTATVVTSNLNGGNPVTKTTRDLFTLRKDGGLWKIYRYAFNNAN